MVNDFLTDNPELEALYQKYENAPDSHVFAPLADAYRKAGMLEEARVICDKGVDKHPRYTSGYVVQGKCYYDLDKPERAESAFRKVLELDQNNLVALKYLGMIQLERGNKNGAMKHFEHILALDPENKEIKFKLEDLSEGSSRPHKVADRGFEGEPISLGEDDETPDDLATTTLADIYAEQGYTDKAEKIYREILKKQPDNDLVKKKLRALEGGGFTRLETPSDDDTGEPPGRDRSAEKGEVDSPVREGSHPEVDPVEDESPAEVLEAEDAPLADEVKAGEKAPAAGPKPAPPIDERDDRPAMDDGKSYEQFKRWLKNLTE